MYAYHFCILLQHLGLSVDLDPRERADQEAYISLIRTKIIPSEVICCYDVILVGHAMKCLVIGCYPVRACSSRGGMIAVSVIVG